MFMIENQPFSPLNINLVLKVGDAGHQFLFLPFIPNPLRFQFLDAFCQLMDIILLLGQEGLGCLSVGPLSE